MGDGLKHAVLEAICSRGPWETAQGGLTTEMVCAAYDAVVAGKNKKEIAEAMGIPTLADRRGDRCMQMLRKAGLIRFGGKPLRWSAEEG